MLLVLIFYSNSIGRTLSKVSFVRLTQSNLRSVTNVSYKNMHTATSPPAISVFHTESLKKEDSLLLTFKPPLCKNRNVEINYCM